MLAELTITDFAIIDRLRINLAAGFNVLTGETGAGKSIIIDAVGLLLGARPEATSVRAGSDRALIEGVFELPISTELRELLEANELLNDEEPDRLWVAREIRSGGRSTARVNGRAVPASMLREIGERLIDIHGQSEHLSLLRPKEHVNLLDRYAGTWETREQLAHLVGHWREVRKELGELLKSEAELARRADMLKFQIDEIRAAKLKPGEDDELLLEQKRLANAEALAQFADEAYAALYEGDGETPAALDALAQAHKALTGLARIDPKFAEHVTTLTSVVAQVDDLAREAKHYREAIQYSPRRLNAVEERLDLIKRLKRKYGAAIGEVLAFGERAAKELDGLEHAGERIDVLRREEDRLLHEIGRAGTDLSAVRQAAAEKLSQAIEVELNDLRMAGARFGVDLKREADPNGAYAGAERVAFDGTGLDRVEFLIAPNVGEGLKPLVKIASGGETARLMLALKTVLSRADQTPTLIFDEIDQGIGGRVGSTVGQKLWGLSQHHQVLCVTHLPQLAGFGDEHFKVDKLVDGARTITHVAALDHTARVQELAQMLGASGDGAIKSAKEILAGVADWKKAAA
ncbi:MAG TPA: DNA repair protein RecN [Anaerolineae bacterium]|nr:DNA repair protein RecN [Anaerolineae bacterium]